METTLARVPETVDGVRLFAGRGRGPTRATLSFRVGTIDEPVNRRGITRLISRIACAAAGHGDDVTIGFAVSSFAFTGDPAAVAHELGALSHSLRVLDARIFERLVHGEIAEPHQHSPEHSWLLRARYGPSGWGADTVPEYAVRSLDLDTVQGWAETYFAAGNAVLAFSGELPETLRLPLPVGNHCAPPAHEPTIQTLPALRRTRPRPLRMGGILAIDASVERTAAALTGRALRHRLDDAFRNQLGSRLEPRSGVLGLGPDRVHLALWAQRADPQPARALDVAVRTLDAAADSITDEEVHFYAQRRLSSLQDYSRSSAGGHALLERTAVGSLTGVPWDLAAEKAELADVTGQHLGRQTQQLRDSLLVLVPGDAQVPRPWPAIDEPAAVRLTDAATYRSRPAYMKSSGGDRPDPRRLLVAADGLTVATLHGPDEVLRWSDVRLAVRYDDGRRLLTDDCDRTVDIRPEHWLNAEWVAAEVDAHCPPDVATDAGVRVTPEAPRAGRLDRLPQRVWRYLLLALSVVLLAVALPWWPAGTQWPRAGIGAAALVALGLATTYAADVWRTERRLRR